MQTTLNKIREYSPCADGWAKLLRSLNKTAPDDEPLSIVQILDSNGFYDAVWCLRAVEGYEKELKTFSLCCANRVRHLMRDSRSIEAINVAERFMQTGELRNYFSEVVGPADDASREARANQPEGHHPDLHAAALAAETASLASYLVLLSTKLVGLSTFATATTAAFAEAEASEIEVREIYKAQAEELRRICQGN